jgi:hypothetical protein
MTAHKDATFSDQHVMVDGNQYFGCNFTRCEMIYAGGDMPQLGSLNAPPNKFDSCTWRFDGPAERTVDFMRRLYEGGFQDLIERTFDSIRGKPGPGVKAN